MIGKALVVFGLFMLVFGAVLNYFPNVFTWFGKLPGDFRDAEKGAFPLASMLLMSGLVLFAFSLIGRFL